MSKTLYKVAFINQEEAYEIYAAKVYQADLFGFIAIEEINFGRASPDSLVVDPSEERMRREFRDVKRLFVPMHSIIRVEEVEKTGAAKITAISDKVAQLHRPAYTEGSTDKVK